MPDSDYVGIDTFQYQVNDGTAQSNVATASIDVVQFNNPPLGTSRAVNIAAGGPYALACGRFRLHRSQRLPARPPCRRRDYHAPQIGKPGTGGHARRGRPIRSPPPIWRGDLVFVAGGGRSRIPRSPSKCKTTAIRRSAARISIPVPKTLTFNYRPVAQRPWLHGEREPGARPVANLGAGRGGRSAKCYGRRRRSADSDPCGRAATWQPDA